MDFRIETMFGSSLPPVICLICVICVCLRIVVSNTYCIVSLFCLSSFSCTIIDSEGRLRTKLSDKRGDFNFPIVNFPFVCSNIPAATAYGVYISPFIRYSRACGSYQDFLDRGLLLTRKLLSQGFLLVKLKSSLRKFYGRHPWLTVMEYLCHK